MAIITHVFFDMDGFLVDINHAFKKLFGLPDDWHGMEYDFYSSIGLTEDQFMNAFNQQTTTFWENLPQIEEGMRLLRKTISLGYNSHILSTSPFKTSSDGKFAWVMKNTPEMKEKTILVTSSKGKVLLSGRRKVLFDDSGRNIHEWRAKGGTGMLLRNHSTLNEYPHLTPSTFQEMEEFLEKNSPA